MPTHLDPGQVIKGAYDEPNQAIQVRGIAGGLVSEKYDEIALTYVAAGNGAGQIQTATYKLAGGTVATLTLTYDAANKLIDVVKT